MTLSPDEKQLYVTIGNLNAVAVMALSANNSGGQGGWPHSDRLVPELGELQRRWQIGVRGQWQVADGRKPDLLL